MSQHKDAKTGKWYFTGKYRDLNGKRHDYKKRGYKTSKAAREAEDLFIAKIKGSKIRVTLDTLVSVYETEYEALGVKEATLIGDESYYENHLKSVFGKMYVDEIDTKLIEQWKIHMVQKPRRNKEGTEIGRYAENTVNHAKNVLSKYLTYAVQKGYIEYNPARNVKKYKDPNRRKRKKSEEENFWEYEEFNNFISFVDDKYWREVFEFLYGTGLREGELFALTWDFIDFKENKIYIEHSITSKTKSKGVKSTTPKTDNSFRAIDMQGHIKDLLGARYEVAKKLDGFRGSFFVFGDIRPLSRSTLARRLDAYITTANIKRITPHGFRHSHATMLIHAGIDDSLIAERLGHTVAELRKTYAHVYNKQRKSLVGILDQMHYASE